MRIHSRHSPTLSASAPSEESCAPLRSTQNAKHLRYNFIRLQQSWRILLKKNSMQQKTHHKSHLLLLAAGLIGGRAGTNLSRLVTTSYNGELATTSYNHAKEHGMVNFIRGPNIKNGMENTQRKYGSAIASDIILNSNHRIGIPGTARIAICVARDTH